MTIQIWIRIDLNPLVNGQATSRVNQPDNSDDAGAENGSKLTTRAPILKDWSKVAFFKWQ